MQGSKPGTDEKGDFLALKRTMFATIGVIGGLFITITVVILQLFKLRKKLSSRYYRNSREHQGPQILPLLPHSPTSLTTQQSPTTDHYLTPNISMHSLPSDDTREVNSAPISTRGVSINGSRFGTEINSLYTSSSQGLQTVSRSSQEPIYPDHHYEEVLYNEVVLS